MKKLGLLLMLLMFTLCGCTKQSRWQEQYDLGMQYLEEGNYDEAIVAFAAAIKIEPNQALAYVGRGDAYVLSDETARDLVAAETDYLKALELDHSAADVYEKLSDAYLLMGNNEKATQILQQGTEITRDETLTGRLEEIQAETLAEEIRPFWRVTYVGQYSADGTLEGDYTYTYREDGYCSEYTDIMYDALVSGQLLPQWEHLYQYIYDETARTVTWRCTSFGEEIFAETFEWIPGSIPANQQQAMFWHGFGTFIFDQVTAANLYAEGDERDSYQVEMDGKIYTVQNEWDENDCLTAAYTYNADGILVGYTNVQYEYFDPAIDN